MRDCDNAKNWLAATPREIEQLEGEGACGLNVESLKLAENRQFLVPGHSDANTTLLEKSSNTK